MLERQKRKTITERENMFGLFTKKDPVCGMKEEKGKGIEAEGHWFCSNDCLKEYKKGAQHKGKEHSCCH